MDAAQQGRDIPGFQGQTPAAKDVRRGPWQQGNVIRDWQIPVNPGAETALFEEVPVLANELALVAGHSELIEDGVHRADRLTVGAVDTGNRVYEVLLDLVVGLDAVDGAYFDAGCVFHADAGLSYYEWHIVNLKALPALTSCSVLRNT
jgi:hypothetical protein